MLNANAIGIGRPSVESNVLLGDHLGDLAILANHIMWRSATIARLPFLNIGRVRTSYQGVDDDVRDGRH
jgi:hypothetical protein